MVTIKISIYSVEHLVKEHLIDIWFESEYSIHELFLGDLSLIVMVCHSEDICKNESHFLGTLIKLIDGVKHIICDDFVVRFVYFGDSLFFMMFKLFVAKSLIDFLLFAKVILEKFNVMAVLF